MAILFVDSSTNAVASTTEITLTLPAGVLEGHCCIAVVNMNEPTDIDLTERSGTWTQIAERYSNDSSDSNMAVFRKIMGAVPDTDVTFDSSGISNFHWTAVCAVFSGVDPVTPEDAVHVTAGGIDGARPVCPAITTVTDGAVVLACGGSTEPTAATAPAGYDFVGTIEATNGVQATHAVISARLVDVAGTETPGTYTGFSGGSTADCWSAVTVALRPAQIPDAVAPDAAAPVTYGGGHSDDDYETRVRAWWDRHDALVASNRKREAEEAERQNAIAARKRELAEIEARQQQRAKVKKAQRQALEAERQAILDDIAAAEHEQAELQAAIQSTLVEIAAAKLAQAQFIKRRNAALALLLVAA